MSSDMHRLLKRQLKRHLGSAEEIPEQWQNLIDAVNQAYWGAETDRNRLEHTLELSSQELLEANTQLQMVVQTVENQVTERTAALLRANTELEITLKELKQTQMQLVQQEKMSSLGRLVAGIAHEINNPVSFIYGNLVYAKDYMDNLLELIDTYRQAYPQPEAHVKKVLVSIDPDYIAKDTEKLFQSIQNGADRIKQIVLALRNFSRLDEAKLKPTDLHEGIDSTLMLLTSRFKKIIFADKIQLIQQYGALPKLECYASELNQVFMHLLGNALDALETCPKFAVSATTLLEQCLEATVHQQLQKLIEIYPHLSVLGQQQQPTIWIFTQVVDDKVQLWFVDNGSGIAERISQQIFDPFFTTKPVGQGMGLGLSLSYQIVTQKHQGILNCYSIPGLGTAFLVALPIKPLM
jgi:two-component system, NtrC family, sensor kinase